jgi:hypothetical protein
VAIAALGAGVPEVAQDQDLVVEAGQGLSVGEFEVATPSGYQWATLTPLGMYMTAMRTGFCGVCAWARAEDGIITSNQGRPRLRRAPAAFYAKFSFSGIMVLPP